MLAIKYIDNFNTDKIRFSLNGVVTNRVTDTLLPDNTVSSKSGNYELIIQNNEVIYHKQSVSLLPINGVSLEKRNISNPYIGVIDT